MKTKAIPKPKTIPKPKPAAPGGEGSGDHFDFRDFADAAEWEAWLKRHHGESGGVWLKIAKKGSGKPSIGISDALDVALCYGWIDSHRRGFDAFHFLQRYSLRRSKSPWSRLNVDRAEALIAAKRMRAPGLEEIRAAKADGRWDAAYASQKTAGIPPDFAAALTRNKIAAAAFGKLGKSEQYAVVLPLLKATTPAVRAARVQKAIDKLAA
jgi:uncharacterized protein YdeI (YjbR/CyaY-like superfamily)